MLKNDYKRSDFKEIKENNNKKKYFIRINGRFIEVEKKIFLLYKADYQRTRRTQIKEYNNQVITVDLQSNLLLQYQHLQYYRNQNTSIYTIEQIDIIKQAISSLSKEEQKIIFLLFYNNYSESKASKIMGISQQLLHYRKRKILKKLKHYLLNNH